jgi:hypothetical protein
MFTKSFLPRVGVAFVCLSLLLTTACNAPQNPTDNAATATDTSQQATPTANADSVTYIPETERATKLSQKYKFEEKESFDRCAAATIQYKDGKAVDLPKDVLGYLDCYDKLDLRKDRHLVYDTDKSFFLYDMDKKASFKVFDKAKDIYYYSVGWSPNGKKQLFMAIHYAAKGGKAVKLMVFEYNDDFTAVVSKKKIDTKVCYIEVEGPPAFNKPTDLMFVDDNTLQVNQAVCDTMSFSSNFPQNLVKIDLNTIK